jgi:hypothetical protein
MHDVSVLAILLARRSCGSTRPPGGRTRDASAIDAALGSVFRALRPTEQTCCVLRHPW